MRYLLIVLGLFVSFFGNAQSQGVTNAQTKLRPNQLRWSPTDATLDSVYIIRADTATGEPGWYLVTLGGSGGGVADTTLSGDVIGGLNSTFVRKINGVTVENKTPQNREVLTYNGTQWTPDSIDLADLPTLAQSVLLGRGSASTGVPQAISLGTGLSMSGTTLSNSAPDQTVTISGATGTYPNFTVTPTSPAGSSMQVQYNNAGSFGALDSFTVSANPDRVGIGVPTPTARLDIQGSGATSATKALRIRNSTGTDLFTVRNDGQLQVNSNTEASKSSLLLSGTGFSGGTATTTKPTLLIETTGTTSTGWSTSGTKLGVNAESGFSGRALDIQYNGLSCYSISATSSDNVKTSYFGGNEERFYILNSGAVFTFQGGNNGYAMKFATTATTDSRNSASYYWFTSTFSPTSGTQSNSQMQLAPTINQTGGATGITRGLYINPTLTAATDFRALEIATGKTVLSTDLTSFGGTTSSYPALKRNGTGLDVRLADDSGYTAIQTLYDRFGSGSPESVVTAPVGAVYHRTDGGAGTSLYVKESGTGNTGWVAK